MINCPSFLTKFGQQARQCQLQIGHTGPHHHTTSNNDLTWDDIGGLLQKLDMVNHPSHYGGDNVYEHIKVCEAWGLGYALGNATKYICRAEKKGNILEDLKKARWYLDYEIQRLEKEKK